MKVVIAEKPSLGRAIAEGLGMRFQASDGVLRSPDLAITWVFGHILELADAHEYDSKWKSWSAQTLPIKIEQWRYKVSEPKQLRIIADLLRQADEVIHAGDPDREGQLLVDEVLHYLKWKGPTKRLLLNATDAASVRKAWQAIKPNSDFEPLYRAGLCRQRADWLVGINCTRAATLLASNNGSLIAVGRVMTPTLALVVQRDRSIEGFEQREFWKVAADLQTDCGQRVRLVHDPAEHIFDKSIASAIARSVQGQTVSLQVKQEKKTERPPLPWHLGDYQRAMQKRFGLKLAQSLQILQGLYEKKLVSYPRTDCRYLPEEQKDQAVPIAKGLYGLSLQDWQVRAMRHNEARLAPKSWIYDNSKVAEHHGIIPTGMSPKGVDLSETERKCFDAIVEHFCKTLLPNYEYLQTTVSFTDDAARVFQASAQQPLNWDESWKCLIPKDEQEQAKLPPIKGRSARVLGTELISGKTTPPAYYTEATLAQDMEAVAKYATDERIKARLKETSGIGTAATRSAIIEKLKRYGMIEEFKKSEKGKAQAFIRSTVFGRQVIDAMPKSIKDAALTATWEEALNMMAQRQYNDADFMSKIDHYVDRLIENMRALPPQKRVSEPPSVRERASNSKHQSRGSEQKSGAAPSRAPRRRSTAKTKASR